MADGGQEPKKVVAHKPGGGNKEDNSQVDGKVDTGEHSHHKAGGGHTKIFDEHLDFSNIKSAVDSENSSYVPGGGHVKIESHHLHFKERARSRTDTGLVDDTVAEEEPTEIIPDVLAPATSPRRKSQTPSQRN